MSVPKLESETLAVFVAAEFEDAAGLMANPDPALLPVQRSIADSVYAVGREETVLSHVVQSCQRTLDGSSYRLQIKDGLRWHDGAELTAEDVAACLREAVLPGGQLTPLALTQMDQGADPQTALSGIEAASRNRVDVRLRRPVDDLFSLLALTGHPWLRRAGAAGEPVWSGVYAPENTKENTGGGPVTLNLHGAHPRAGEGMFRRIRIYRLARDADRMAELALLAPLMILGCGIPALPEDLQWAVHGRWSRLPFGWMVCARGEGRHLQQLRTRLAAACASVALAPMLAERAVELAAEAQMPPRGRRRADDGRPVDPQAKLPPLEVVRPLPEPADPILREAASGTLPADERLAAIQIDWHAGPQEHDPLGVAERLLGVSAPGRVRGAWRGDRRLESWLTRRDAAALRQSVAGALDEMQRHGSLMPLLAARVCCAGNDLVTLSQFVAAGESTDLAQVRPAARAARGRIRAGSKVEDGVSALIQMVAHDVRRPFSMVRIIMDAVTNATSLAESRETCARLLPGLDAALRHVDGMLNDILEAGSDRSPVTEALPVAQLVDAALGDSLAARPRDDVRLVYHLAHTHCLAAEPSRMRRVLANIIINALEAMPPGGLLGFDTRDVLLDGRPAVHLVIENTGTLIHPARVARVFEPFYTFGKRGGTGLGLAIARKIVEAHGGRVWCRSDAKAARVSFHLVLPATRDDDRAQGGLPPDTGAMRQRLAATALGDPAARQAAAAAIGRLATCSRLALMIVDDDPEYARFLETMALRVAGQGGLTVRRVSHADGALIMAAEEDFDLVICDVDLSTTSAVDGFEVTRRLREAGYSGRLCIHSNRADSQAYVDAVRVGADAFLPKPMSEAHLARFLADAGDAQGRCGVRPEPVPARRPVVLVVDDDPFMREAWSAGTGEEEAEVRTYEHPESLLAAVAAEPELAGREPVLVLDWWFEAGAHATAGEAWAELKKALPEARFVLCTDMGQIPEPLHQVRRISKRPHTWRELLALLD